MINRPTEITFDGRFSYHPQGRKIVTMQWEFGDGTTTTGPRVTRSYRPDGPYRREMVKLTVTDADGLSDSWVEYVEVTDGQMAARKVDTDKLQPGMVAEAWKKGSLQDLSFTGKPADVWRGIVNWYNLTGKTVGEGPLKRYTGWFEVGQSGLHELRAAGPSGDGILRIDGTPVIDTTRTVDYGWGYQPYLQQRARVFLEKGWHRFELCHDRRQHTFTWNGPGVVYKNAHQDVAPVYHLPEEAVGAEVRYWRKGAPSSNGRPLVDRNGKAPDRTSESGTVIDK